HQCATVTGLSREQYRFLCEVAALLRRREHRRCNGKARGHERPEASFVLSQAVAGLREQIDLLTVEHVDFEAGKPRSQTQGRARKEHWILSITSKGHRTEKLRPCLLPI